MRQINYSIDDIKSNVRKNKKGMFIIFAVSVAFGVCIGIFFGLNYKQPEYTLDDTIVETVDFDSIEKDEKYYFSAVSDLREKKLALESYVQYLKLVDLGGESKENIGEFEEKLESFYDVYNEVMDVWQESSSVGYGNKEEIEKFIQEQIDESEEKIEAANEMMKEVNNHSFTRGLVTVTETTALNSITLAKSTKEYWKQKQENFLNADEEEIQHDNVMLDELLSDSESELNNLISAFNKMIGDMESREQYDILYNKYLLKQYILKIGLDEELEQEDILNNAKSTALIYAKSIAGLDSGKERFCAYVTFFTLFGIMLSLLYGGFHISDRKKR